MELSLWMALMFGKLSGNVHVKSPSQHSGMRRISLAQRKELQLGGGWGVRREGIRSWFVISRVPFPK